MDKGKKPESSDEALGSDPASFLPGQGAGWTQQLPQDYTFYRTSDGGPTTLPGLGAGRTPPQQPQDCTFFSMPPCFPSERGPATLPGQGAGWTLQQPSPPQAYPDHLIGTSSFYGITDPRWIAPQADTADMVMLVAGQGVSWAQPRMPPPAYPDYAVGTGSYCAPSYPGTLTHGAAAWHAGRASPQQQESPPACCSSSSYNYYYPEGQQKHVLAPAGVTNLSLSHGAAPWHAGWAPPQQKESPPACSSSSYYGPDGQQKYALAPAADDSSRGDVMSLPLHSDQLVITEVWSDSLQKASDEIARVLDSAERSGAECRFIAIDSEFCIGDGVAARPNEPPTPEEHYEQLKLYVNDGNLVQVGMVFADMELNILGGRAYQFNIRFDPQWRSPEHKGVSFLRKSRLKLEEHAARGVPPDRGGPTL
ncbi:hypothetical protein BS78_02G233200 [Paspalum vaginatum]|nr:hypothetical protein BS78_02G233200 [Paspalum vaginatum]